MLLRLILYVAPYYISRHLAAYASYKVPITLQFSCPEALPEPWKPLKHLPCRYAIHYLHYTCWRIPWRRFQKYMHVIVHYFHRVHPESIFLRYSSNYLFGVLSYFTYQDLLPILGFPHQVILKIKNGMFCPSISHVPVIQPKAMCGQTPLVHLAVNRFPPVSKLTGIQRFFL